MIVSMREQTWSFLTNHGQILLRVAEQPDIRLRDLAADVGITERAAHRIVSELVDSGYVERHREGRRNRYLVKLDRSLPLVRDVQLDDLLNVFRSAPAS